MGCREVLKEKGYRLTPQRSMIVDVLHNAEKHITPEEIHRQVSARFPEVNKSTVYRTLDVLKKLDLVDETDLGGNKLYYHHADHGHHHHLICQRCGRAIEIDEKAFDPFKKTLMQKYNFVPDIRHLAIFGECVSCDPGHAPDSPDHIERQED
ncbi:MAG: transcriptional repressor [Chloroflexi bacterium]|nr:transcriptional repressor [Chloroflexota bacterium]